MNKAALGILIVVLVSGCGATREKPEDEKGGIVSSEDSGQELANDYESADLSPAQEGSPTLKDNLHKAVSTENTQDAIATDDNHKSVDDVVESKPSENILPSLNLDELPANTHVISLQKKTKKHPFYGIGDPIGFILDGKEGKELVLKRGNTYTFIVKSTPMHDVYVSSDEMGWGAKVVEEGIEGNFIYDGRLVITPSETTPSILFYQCQNHKAMGARLFVVDQEDTRTLAQLQAEYGKLIGGGKSGHQEVSGADVKQKLSYAKMVVMSKPAKRVQASNNEEAKALFAAAQNMLAQAGDLVQQGDNAAAMALIDDALRGISQASQLVPSEGVKEEKKQRYLEMVNHLQQQESNHKDVVERVASQGQDIVDYDKASVESLRADAAMAAGNGNYDKAIRGITEADKLVTTAINQMLDSQTLEYELNIDTPEGEYQYEKNRYLGYAELVPIAKEEKKPSAGQLMLLENFVTKSQKMSEKAEQEAVAGNYPDAIRLMQEGTKQVRKALRMLGVKQ